MTLITFASIKGSPGVTTLACLVGATWPAGRRAIVAECDSHGGDLASRFNLSTKTGWQSLAIAARRGDAGRSIEDHLQNLPGGLEVLVGNQGGNADGVGRHAGQEAANTVRELAQCEHTDVIVDLGRLHFGSPETQMWLGLSATVCILFRSDAASIGHARDRARALRELCGGRLLLVVVGNGPYSVPEIERFVGTTDIIEIADDPSAAAVLTAGHGTERRLARSALVKSARRLALALANPEQETSELGDADVKPVDHTPSLGNKPEDEASESLTKDTGAETSDRPLSLQDRR
jgi:hypothetical protein